VIVVAGVVPAQVGVIELAKRNGIPVLLHALEAKSDDAAFAEVTTDPDRRTLSWTQGSQDATPSWC
jgi:ABC-type sugar transport system substrate-binding protein